MQRTDHWITQLKNTRIPENHLIFDTEAYVVKHGPVFEHKFACAVTRTVNLEADGFHVADLDSGFDTPAKLWMDICECLNEHGGLTVWAHNLAYDLRVSDALHRLVELEWDLQTISLVPQATWCKWKKGKATLTMLDTMSWLPGPLERIASDLGDPRRHFEYKHAVEPDLVLRCVDDTRITAQAVCRILNFLKTEDLGNFRPTGSGQSHAALRKRFLPERSIRVHTDPRALAAEREAMHTGRCEAWRYGKITGPLYEFDMNLAYCRIAARWQVPGNLAFERASITDSEWKDLLDEYCILTEVDVLTEEPVVPVTTDNGVIWPVGRFRTTLWDPEMDLLFTNAQDRVIRRAWLYRRTDALQSMCLWLIDRLEAPVSEVPALEKHMLKHWARTVVGRCGLRYRSWEYFGEHPRPELCLSYEPNDVTGEVNHNMRIGRQMLQLAALAESASSVPSIPGWVASKCRAELWELIQRAHVENVYYMDTDGLLVNPDGAAAFTAHWIVQTGRHLVCRGERRNVTIHGPRNVELGDERRLSGVPRKAIKREELTFEGETWSGLEYALSTGHTDMVEVSSRLWHVTPTDKRRIHLPDGRTEPYRLESDE